MPPKSDTAATKKRKRATTVEACTEPAQKKCTKRQPKKAKENADEDEGASGVPDDPKEHIQNLLIYLLTY